MVRQLNFHNRQWALILRRLHSLVLARRHVIAGRGNIRVYILPLLPGLLANFEEQPPNNDDSDNDGGNECESGRGCGLVRLREGSNRRLSGTSARPWCCGLRCTIVRGRCTEHKWCPNAAVAGAAQVVAGDPFNSDPQDQESMSDDVRQRIRAGEQLQVSPPLHPIPPPVLSPFPPGLRSITLS